MEYSIRKHCNMEKCFLTNGGNLLRFHNTLEKYYFQKPSGEFIREVSNSEAEYLAAQCIEIQGNFPDHPEFFPTWYFIKSICVEEDYSNYKPETSSNGGDYAFYRYEDWFMTKYPSGEWKFACVIRHGTSAEFSYDELGGGFQSDLGWLYISNGVDCPSYNSQQGKSWEGEEVYYSTNEVLEKVGEISTFQHLWKAVTTVYYSEEERKEIPLTFTEKKEIVSKIKEIHISVTGEGIEKFLQEPMPRRGRAIWPARRGGGRR